MELKKSIRLSLVLFTCLSCNFLHGQNLDSVQSKLENVYLNSLKQRKKITEYLNKYGMDSPQFDSLNREILTQDSTSLIQVIQVIESYGWLSKKQVGATANQALFITIQHADSKIIEKYFPLLQNSALSNDSNLADMALMEDRILIDKGLPQKYGTQYKFDDAKKRFVFYELSNLKSVNKARRSVGLERIQKYSKRNNILLF